MDSKKRLLFGIWSNNGVYYIENKGVVKKIEICVGCGFRDPFRKNDFPCFSNCDFCSNHLTASWKVQNDSSFVELTTPSSRAFSRFTLNH